MNWDKFFQIRAELGRPLVMAHRGASALLPENSLSAFERALTDGADLLETDLHFSKDNELVVIHDGTLDRTVEGTGNVRDYTLAELKQFRLKQPLERAEANESILSLRELLAFSNGAVPLALELKTDLFQQPRYAKILADLLAEFNVLEECAVISFSKARIAGVKAVAPSLAGGWITLNNPFPNQPTELLGPFWPLLLLNPFYIKRAHSMGKIVAPLDPAPEKRLGMYQRMGADVLLTDNPAKTLAALKKLSG
jgi:glycerophosphoryl diester phosphodiesterase